MSVRPPASLTDLAAGPPKSLSWRGAARGGVAAAVTIALFAGMAGLLERWATYQAESFGDRRLASPLPAECDMARVLLQDIHDHPAAVWKADGDQQLGLRAFAWRSSGERTPGQGADWRKCHGLGPYVRHLGMVRLASGELGPMVYISRATVDPAGDAALVWETFYPPAARSSDPTSSWTITLRRDHPAGRWRIADRAPGPLAKPVKRRRRPLLAGRPVAPFGPLRTLRPKLA